MDRRLTSRELNEMADLRFLKITEQIFKVQKDRRKDFSGSSYVSSEDVLESLNNRKVIVYNDSYGLSSHSNF
ncbi:hypothetical protein [Lederbergia lenta]|uniref:hypothetical protein n=1 Tax=Lederbergia lenta TaxID=1467 RepID=UPI002041FA47|nr:hypothetical protein [Lederbergia lenta]MCM3109931.1 hypothetical protein [Lederbergia lenta]